MAFKYLITKGIGKRGHVEGKSQSKEWSFEQKQVYAMLREVEKSKDEFNENWLRDYALLYLAYGFGLRVGEVVQLERRHFRDIIDMVVHLPTLKKSKKIVYRCTGEVDGEKCTRVVRVKRDRAGKDFTCVRCGTKGKIPVPEWIKDNSTPERDVPYIEEETIQFVVDYMKAMRPDQKFFFESPKFKNKDASGDQAATPARHLSVVTACRIMYTFLARAGLSNKFSFHAFRHGRGKRIFSVMKDFKSVMENLRHDSIKMSARYAAIDEDMKEEAKKKLKRSAAFSPIRIGDQKT